MALGDALRNVVLTTVASPPHDVNFTAGPDHVEKALNTSAAALDPNSVYISNKGTSGLISDSAATKYTLVIILLSVVVLCGIAFVLFGLVLKANAIARSDMPRTSTDRRHSFAKTDIDFEAAGDAALFGAFGGLGALED